MVHLVLQLKFLSHVAFSLCSLRLYFAYSLLAVPQKSVFCRTEACRGE